MPTFSKASKKILATVHPDLQRLFEDVVRVWDCKPTDGLRTEAEQKALYAKGRTRPGPIVTNCDGVKKLSNHQRTAIVAGKSYGLALDIVPYPVDYDDEDRIRVFAGFVLGVAYKMGIPVRWGGDWDGDTDLHDQELIDLPHFELVLPG